MIDTLWVLEYEKVPGLDEEKCPGYWKNEMTFDWRDVYYIKSYTPDKATIANDIYPQECSLIYMKGEIGIAWVVKIKPSEAKAKFINSRTAKPSTNE